MRKMTLTIGIPAFNEEANISYLLKDLFDQKLDTLTLKEIIISSDGSTDKTVTLAKSASFKKGAVLKVIANKSRKGRAVRQNEIMKLATSDVLVLLDADVLIDDRLFIEKLTAAIVQKKADLTSAKVLEIEETALLGKILSSSMDFKRSLFEKINKGNNLYTCHGRARAFSKNLYKQIVFKESVGEDAYSYLYAIKNGFTYRFAKNAEVFYKLPATLADHEKQSIRFYRTQQLFEKDFGKELVEKENYLNTFFIIKNFSWGMIRNPYLFLYVGLATFLKLKSFYKSSFTNQWSVSESSKKVRGAI